MTSDSLSEANRRNWDERVAIHVRDPGEIGDVSGKRIAHLQCHFGLDTSCLARRGAEVTGLDFSPAATRPAR